MTVVGIQLIDRVGRRRLLLIGAIGMCVCEFIVAIVGVTAGHINPITQAVNVPAQKVLIAFVCMYVLFSSLLLFSFFSLYLFFSHRYIAFFAISWGPVAWVITGEIFVSFSFFLVLIKHVAYFTIFLFLFSKKKPLAIRAKGMSLSVASNWLWNFGIGYATPYLVNPTTTGINGIKAANLGVKVFFIWGSTCLGCYLFT